MARWPHISPMEEETVNMDHRVVESFGDEWKRFDQTSVSDREQRLRFNEYFDIFPWSSLPEHAVGFDLGCGSGRWAQLVADRVGTLHCVDPSAQALATAQTTLASKHNCVFHLASVENMPFEDGSMDFGYALGVLHHVPDTLAGIRSCVNKLKPGAPLLLYLYYALENRPLFYRNLWRLTDMARRAICRCPSPVRYAISQGIATTIYYPLARGARLLEAVGADVTAFPLAAYRNLSFYAMRTDALDRFGTRLERRFTAAEIQNMMLVAGLERLTFSNSTFWCVVGYKSRDER